MQGKDVEEINFEGTQLEKQVINKGTNTLIVKEFMEECIKDGNGVLPSKTIFFCSSKAHARHILGIEVLKSFPDEVSGAFAQFIHIHTMLSGRQLEFINLLEKFIIEREKVDKKDLINTPFTLIHP